MILYEVYILSNLRITKRTFILFVLVRYSPYDVGILLLLHGSRAAHGLVHVATAVKGQKRTAKNRGYWLNVRARF